MKSIWALEQPTTALFFLFFFFFTKILRDWKSSQTIKTARVFVAFPVAHPQPRGRGQPPAEQQTGVYYRHCDVISLFRKQHFAPEITQRG